MSEHIWCQENLESYAAGGLTPEERDRFDRHAAECADCARDLAEWRDVEDKLDNLFAAVRPEAGLEDRMIQTLRQTRMPRRFFRSTIVRFAMSAAAVVFVGVMGAALYAFAPLDDLVFPGQWGWDESVRTQSNNNLKQFAHGTALHGMHFRKPEAAMGEFWADGEGRVDNGIGLGTGTMATYKRGASFGLPNSFQPSGFVSGLTPSGTSTTDLNLPIKTGSRVENLAQLQTELGRSAGIRGFVDTDGTAVAQGAGPEAPGTFHGSGSTALNTRQLERAPGQDGTPAQNQVAALAKEYRQQMNAGRIEDARAPSLIPTNSQITSNEGSGKPDPAKLYFRLKPLEKNAGRSETLEERKLVEDASISQKAGKKPFGAGGDVHARPGTNLSLQKPETGAPLKMERKIIRTGDIEFEVDSFDTAVERINALINATKGAFVATTNSDKLPNGKVKGSVVVRMPPDNLDKFLLDLRKDLGKMGDLKSQRIGSQDISKQYTDIESRLRAAKTMEERLLKIIASGKGEVKDLVAAERELGNWRTKIEEMEGEIRYYNNQVSLSTLTISLYEKEIRAPSALVVTERITMRIETEDVEKAQQSAVKAVMDAKGRVTKSELKQHAAGQLEAIVTAEAAPAAAAGLRTSFKQLGIVTKLDSDRLQQATGGGKLDSQEFVEGGSGNLTEIKTRQNDVQFNLTLYNVANIQPRETFNVQVATLDVPGGFRKLQEIVTKAKGQVRNGQLNEQDKTNITANFDFDVPSQDLKTIDKALEEAGRIISRSTAQAPPSETVTDSKAGYRLVLRSVAGIAPREKVTLAIDVKDVEKTADEFINLVRAQKGTVAAARDSQEASGRITALLLFDVPLTAKDELVNKFKTAGRVRVRQTTSNPQVPDNDLATAHLDVTLASSGPIVPNDEGMWPQIRTSLFYSFKMLSWSVMFIILGLAVVVPWALVIWGVYRVVRRMRGKVSASP